MRAIALRYDARGDDGVRRQLVALARRLEGRPARVWDLWGGVADPAPVLLTFDDGGAGGCGRLAELLEAFGWRGHFFVTPGFIDAPGFLTADGIRALARRGHVIGIHGARGGLREEWDHGVRVLATILRTPVCVGSVSGDTDARRAAAAAAAAGIQVLFTADPTATARRIDECLVLGRYTMDPSTAPRAAAACAAGSLLPRLRRRVAWSWVKLARALRRGVSSLAAAATAPRPGFHRRPSLP